MGRGRPHDRALSFVRSDDLTPEQREVLTSLGQTGHVLVREQIRPVASAGKMKPATVAARIPERIPFKFSVYSHFPRAWQTLRCRPKTGASRPERTDERYCLYDDPHGDYLYTPAFVEKVVGETNTKEKFEAFLRLAAVPKPPPAATD